MQKFSSHILLCITLCLHQVDALSEHLTSISEKNTSSSNAQYVHVMGFLNTVGEHLSSIHISGTAKLNKTTVDHSTDVTGYLLADHTRFAGNIRIYGQHACLHHSQTNRIIMICPEHQTCTLELSDCRIKGDITFKNHNGILKSDKKTIILGHIHGLIQT